MASSSIPSISSRELDGLRRQRIKIGTNLLISDCAHVVFPYHRLLDECRERAKGDKKIGTTKRGIGPCYGDKVERTGLRMGDLLRPKAFSEKLYAKIEENNTILQAFGEKPIDFAASKQCLPLRRPQAGAIHHEYCRILAQGYQSGQRNSFLKEPREPFSIWTTAPILM